MKLLILSSLACFVSASGSWSYEGTTGPSHWFSINSPHNEKCGEGMRQSPINLSPDVSRCKKTTSRPVPNFKIHGRYTVPLQIVNNGHSIQMNVPAGMTVRIGARTFDVLQAHFHFGSENDQGSEHAIDGKHYSAEMHIVCREQERDSLAVLGFLIKVDEDNNNNNNKNNAAFDDLLEHVENLKKHETVNDIPLTLSKMVSPSIHGKFYQYQGSLTTPPCSEIVTWNVYQTLIAISQEQIDVFRSTGISNNYRPLQKIWSRRILNNAC